MNLFKFYRFFLFCLDAENAHKFVFFILKRNFIFRQKKILHPALKTEVAGIEFPNPVGLAAGFDKNAEAINCLSGQNFGFLEVGTVTPEPQDGNEKPRLFRLTRDKAIINRMGFNNIGALEFKSNFNKSNSNSIPVGINIGKNKNSKSSYGDYFKMLEFFNDMGAYITVNISSPNTPGLRDLQKKEVLEGFIKELSERKKLQDERKIFLKIAPDLSDQELSDICEIVKKYSIDALIISNTTISRPDYLCDKNKLESGGLSGKPVYEMSNQKIAYAYKILKGSVPIIGVGGIFSAYDAYEKIKLGASLVQIYTGLIYQGPKLARDINLGLIKLLKKDGYQNISDAVGKNS